MISAATAIELGEQFLMLRRKSAGPDSFGSLYRCAELFRNVMAACRMRLA